MERFLKVALQNLQSTLCDLRADRRQGSAFLSLANVSVFFVLSSAVGIVTGLPGFDSGQGEEMFLLNVHTDFWPTLRRHICWVPRALSLGLRQPGHETDHSPHLVWWSHRQLPSKALGSVGPLQGTTRTACSVCRFEPVTLVIERKETVHASDIAAVVADSSPQDGHEPFLRGRSGRTLPCSNRGFPLLR
jgi:hypothetical protein